MWGAIAGIAGIVTGLFSKSKMQDVAIDGLRKMGGLDAMSPEDKAKYLLDYLNATQHQSPTRRFIAVLLTGTYVMFLMVWAIMLSVGHLADSMGALSVAYQLKEVIKELVVTPFNIILGFYFVTNIVQRVGGKK